MRAMKNHLAPCWRSVMGAVGVVLLGACSSGAEGPCLGRDDGSGTLAATALSFGDPNEATNVVELGVDSNAATSGDGSVCLAVNVLVYADEPVDSSVDTGALRAPETTAALARGVAGGGKPATFELAEGTYLVCFDDGRYETACERLVLGHDRVVTTLQRDHGSPFFESR